MSLTYSRAPGRVLQAVVRVDLIELWQGRIGFDVVELEPWATISPMQRNGRDVALTVSTQGLHEGFATTLLVRAKAVIKMLAILTMRAEAIL